MTPVIAPRLPTDKLMRTTPTAGGWRLARTIGNLWNVTDYWRTRFGEIDVWNNDIAPSGVHYTVPRMDLKRVLHLHGRRMQPT